MTENIKVIRDILTKDDLKNAKFFETGAGLNSWGGINRDGKWQVIGLDSPHGEYDIKFRSIKQMVETINDYFLGKKGGWIRITYAPENQLKARKVTHRKTTRKNLKRY